MFGWPHNVHIEGRRGTVEEAVAYVNDETKERPIPPERVEWGFINFDSKQVTKGTRTDIHTVATKLINSAKSGGSFKDVVDQNAGHALKYFNNMKAIHTLFRPKIEIEAPELELGLHEWQKDLLAELGEAPKRRTIYVITSEASGTGKSTTLELLESKFKCLTLPSDGVMKHMVHGIKEDEVNTSSRPDVLILNMSRVDELTKPVCAMLEQLADHKSHACQMYSGGDVKRLKCHIVVATNIGIGAWVTKFPKRIIGYCLDTPADPLLKDRIAKRNYRDAGGVCNTTYLKKNLAAAEPTAGDSAIMLLEPTAEEEDTGAGVGAAPGFIQRRPVAARSQRCVYLADFHYLLYRKSPAAIYTSLQDGSPFGGAKL